MEIKRYEKNGGGAVMIKMVEALVIICIIVCISDSLCP